MIGVLVGPIPDQEVIHDWIRTVRTSDWTIHRNLHQTQTFQVYFETVLFGPFENSMEMIRVMKTAEILFSENFQGSKWFLESYFLFEIGENVEFSHKNAIFLFEISRKYQLLTRISGEKKFQKCKCLPVHILVWILNILKVHPEQFFVFAIASLVTEFVDGHSCLVFCYLNKILNYHISHTQFFDAF